jgi:RNA ligase
VVETNAGTEVNIHDGENDIRIRNLINNLGFRVVKKYDGIKDYSVLKEMIRDDEEGFVVRFNNGDRMKVKGVEYLRLHKIMTNVSTTGIWECLKNGDDVLELMKEVPDEFYIKIKSYVKDLRYAHYSISEYCGKMHDGFRYGKYGDVDPEPSKKEYAEFVMKNIKDGLRGVMFQMWDKKDYDETIWKLIKPEFKKL